MTIILLMCCMQFTLAQEKKKAKSKPSPKSISFNITSAEYQRLLGGPPDTYSMHSGLVTLAPGKTVGKHNTEQYEEAIVVLQGEGTMTTKDGVILPLKFGRMLYCPPHTEHDVQNIGNDPLKYIYIVAKTK